MIQNPSNLNYIKYNAPSGALLDEQKQQQLKESIKKTEENPIIKAIKSTGQDPTVVLGTVGFWGFLRAIMVPINKSMSGVYENSMLGKVGAFGDKISNFLHLDKLGKVNKWLKTKSESSTFLKYFTNDFKTKPKNMWAVAMSNGTLGELTQDALQILEKSDKALLESKGITKELIEQISKGTKAEADIGIKKLIEGLNKFGLKDSIKIGKLGFRRTVRYTELANKLKAISSEGGASGLGKSLSKGALRTLEGLTNGTAGGPLAILMQAYCFAQATKAAIEAPKGEKLSTFMENVFQDLGFYLVGTSSLSLLHRAGGNRYRGLTKEALEQYKTLIAKTNEEIGAGKLFGDALKNREREIKNALKGDKNLIKWWEKPFKFFGKILTAGLDKLDPVLKSNPNNKLTIKIGNLIKKGVNKLKGVPGGGLRFFLSMVVITPILVKPIVKLSHLLFGRPTKSVLDKEKSTEEKPVDANAPANPNAPTLIPNQNQSSNYLDILTQKQNTQTQQPTPGQVAPSTPIASNPIEDPSAARKIKNEDKTDSNNEGSQTIERNYVPSSVATEFQETANTGNSQIDTLLQKADSVEQQVLKTL